MAKSIVSLVKYQDTQESLKEAVALCDGFKRLKPGDSVLIKPNLVTWSTQFPIAPYGVFTTTKLVKDMVRLLKEFGCENIAIGEGSVTMQKGVGTLHAFKGLGYEELAAAYGVKLIDFNRSKGVTVDLYADFSVPVAPQAMEADFFINMPVMKTHAATMVSLGIKNLKGALKIAGKKHCHDPKRPLELNFPILAEKLPSHLTIIDGIYILEKGPIHLGNAFRKDLIIASQDILGADIVGAAIMGYAAKDIRHLSFFASRNGRPINIDDYEIKGLALDTIVQPLKCDEAWTPENTGPKVFDKIGISGIANRKFDETLCSGCSLLPVVCNLLTISAFKGKPFDNVEVLIGKKMQAKPGFKHTILAGKCIVKANAGNPNIQHGIELNNCPPKTDDVVKAFEAAGVTGKIEAYEGFMHKQGTKYDGNPEYDPGFYR